MRTRRIVVWLSLAIVFAGAMATPALADEFSTPRESGALKKLGRGIANIATCPAELIRTPELVGRREGILGALSVGVVEGAWRTLLRGVAGVFEVATFYLEIPDDYKPLIHPEFVWEHGNWAE